MGSSVVRNITFRTPNLVSGLAIVNGRPAGWIQSTLLMERGA